MSPTGPVPSSPLNRHGAAGWRAPWPQRRQRLYTYLARRGFGGETITEAISDPDDVALLKTLAQKAIDPLTTFGSDLVTSITVGYMLHAFVGRRDRVNARAVIGSPAIKGRRTSE